MNNPISSILITTKSTAIVSGNSHNNGMIVEDWPHHVCKRGDDGTYGYQKPYK
jgi:hypothetical protein